ncbi:MAG: hypothetical protein INQ03_08340 [Candidatus Heimdallarchaeota archaeon]|nr:hypothetical protein [Candidatus Heimdallarchaeota archaeon]
MSLMNFSLLILLLGGTAFAGIDLVSSDDLSLFIMKISVVLASIMIPYLVVLIFQAKFVSIPGLRKRFEIEFIIKEGRAHTTHYLYFTLKRLLAPYYREVDLFKTNHLGVNYIQFSWPSLGNMLHFVENIDQGKIKSAERLVITGKPRIVDEIIELIDSEFDNFILLPSYDDFQKELGKITLDEEDIKTAEKAHFQERKSIETNQLTGRRWIPFAVVMAFLIFLVIGSMVLETNDISGNIRSENLIIDQSFQENKNFTISVIRNANLYFSIEIEDADNNNISTLLIIDSTPISEE